MIGALFGSVFFALMLSLWMDLSVRRRFRANLETVVKSPDLKMNRIESRLVDSASRITGVFRRQEETLLKD
jgi:hypothetical protein